MEIALSVALGLGLSAACGFRVFVPLLVIGVAGRAGYLSLAQGFDWMTSTPALVAFGVATTLEIAAYYVPWVDNLLDGIAVPASVVAGAVATASVVSGMDPFLKWTLAIIAGGGLAAAVQGLTTGVRQVSAVTTAGLGNPIVSTAELGGSAGLSAVSLAAPFVAVTLVFAGVIGAGTLVARRRRRRARHALSREAG